MTDEEIVMLVQKGQVDKYELLVNRFQRPLISYIRKMINQDYEEVEDLTQDTLIKGYVNIQGFDPKKKFSSWIFRIAHNLCIDYFRKRRVKTENIEKKEEILGTNEKLMVDLEIEEEEKKKVIGAIKALDNKFKELVILYYYEEKSYEEIAEILHMPKSNVGVILFRAKDKLKKLLLTL